MALPALRVLLDTLEEATPEGYYSTGNWSKMTWANDALVPAGEGATISTESGNGTTFGSYWSAKEFNHKQVLEVTQYNELYFGQRAGPGGKGAKPEEEISMGAFALWLCYVNSTHSGYRFTLNKEATPETETPAKWTATIVKVTSGSESTLATLTGVTIEAGEKYLAQLEGKVLTFWRKKPSESVFNEGTGKFEEIPFPWEELLKVTDSGTAFTSGDVGLSIERRTQRGTARPPRFREFENLSWENYTASASDTASDTDVGVHSALTHARTGADNSVDTDTGKRVTSVSKTSSGDASRSVDTVAFSHKKEYFITDPVLLVDAASKLVALPRTASDSATIVDTVQDTFSAPAMRVENGWFAGEGKQSLRAVWHPKAGKRFGIETPIETAGMKALAEKPYTLSAKFKVNSLPSEVTLNIAIAWFGETGSFISLSEGSSPITTSGLHSATVTATAPHGAAFATAQIFAFNHSAVEQEVDLYVDDIIFTATEREVTYFDGDTVGSKWEGQAGQSGSVQVEDGGPGENTVVIDSVLLDPLTPNVAFSVYYSTEGTAEEDTTQTEWERKLWTRVPKTFIANQRQEYVFPEPVKAKFVKVEFSYLQAQSYNPGQNQLPVTYKKFPKWVADFFIAQMEEPQFIANTVGVNYDALDFAYNYFLDDLNQRPAEPIAAPSSVAPTLSQFFSTELETSQVDPETLAKINLALNTFTRPPGAQASANTLLGNKVRQIALSETNYPVETPPNITASNLSEVSSLNRDNVVFEQGLPIMYFYLTCRHYYKELTATFNHNRAYFAGVKEIAFIRHNYTTTYDGELYIETGGDDTNTELNDWTVEPETGWFAY